MHKIIIAIILGFVVITGSISGWVMLKNKETTKASSVSPMGETDTAPVSEENNLIEDEWGLRIYYPPDLRVEIATAPGELARYNFSYPDRDGHISIFTKEASETSITDWLAHDSESAAAGAALDTTVGGEIGRKMRFESPNRTRVAALQAGQVFVFDVFPTEGEEEFWNKRFNGIVEKFEFLPFEGESTSSGGDSGGSVGGGDEGAIVEEETVE